MSWRHRISNVDVNTKTGDCIHCGRVKVFLRKGRKKENGERRKSSWACVIGVTDKNPNLRKTLTQKFTKVPDRCEICGDKGGEGLRDRLVYDHCHKTTMYRGMLCINCNMGLGSFQDNPKILKRAIKYLKEHDTSISQFIDEESVSVLDLRDVLPNNNGPSV